MSDDEDFLRRWKAFKAARRLRLPIAPPAEPEPPPTLPAPPEPAWQPAELPTFLRHCPPRPVLPPARSGVVLGVDEQTGEPVLLDDEERRTGLYVVGVPGTGKTTLLLNMILQDIDAGHGLAVLDPHGDLTLDILARRDISPERVVLLDPTDARHPFGLNLFACADPDDPVARNATVTWVMNVFQKLWGKEGDISSSWGPHLSDLLRHATQTFVQLQGYTLVDVPLLLEDQAFRERVIADPRLNPDLRRYWEQTYQDSSRSRESTLNKVRALTDHELLAPILGQSATTVRIREIMDEGKVLLVRLPAGTVGEEGTTLIGALLTNEILQAMLGRADQERQARRSYSLYIDECHLFVTRDFDRYFTEGRKFGLQTVVAHQTRLQLDPLSRSITRGISNKVAFRIGTQDAQELRTDFSYRPPEPELPIVRRPIDSLLRKGHADPRIHGFVEDSLRRWKELLEALERRERTLLSSDLERLDALRVAFETMDRYLYLAMAERLADGAEEEALLLEIARCLASQFRALRDLSDTTPDRELLANLLTWTVRAVCQPELANEAWQAARARFGDACGVESARVISHLKYLLTDLQRVAALLSESPLRQAGVHGAPEPSGDVVSLLSRLPKFHARVRVGEGGRVVERTIVVPLPDPGVPSSVVSARLSTIRTHALGRYTSSRTEVLVKIRERQRSEPVAPSGNASRITRTRKIVAVPEE